MGSRVKALCTALTLLPLLAAGGCSTGPYPKNGVKPVFSFPVTDNETPYSQCLSGLAKLPGDHLPVFSVGEVADKTGQINYDENGHALTQGVSEMVMSALYKSGKARQVERLDLRIPLAEVKLAEQNRLSRTVDEYGQLPASDFILVGALTELNYNIVSDGAELFVDGIGGGARTVVINIALDLRVIDARNFAVRYVSTLQKQIFGYEVEANIFRFFGGTLVEFDGGKIQNEPLQLGVRSVVEMAVYQILTDYLKLPGVKGCDLVRTGHMATYLEQPAAK
jgi:curli production assembly/transport component CsgG/holdfast attachment protein HfaB